MGYIHHVVGEAPGGPFTKEQLQAQLDELYAEFDQENTMGFFHGISSRIIAIEHMLYPEECELCQS